MIIANNDTALLTAGYLLQIKAIILQPHNPFTWASGWKSPIYCDNRKTLSFPKVRNFIRHELVQAIVNNYGTPDVIAGVATGAIAQGVLVAQQMGLPFIYVRSSSKDHGLSNLIEGSIQPGQSVVVVEDLISTGKSSLKVLEALRAAGSKVIGMVAIFSYGFEESTENFRKSDCPLVTLSDYDSLMQKALETKYITEKDVNILQLWRRNPSEWNATSVTGNRYNR